MINESMARALWPDGDPLGRRLQFGTEAFDPQQFAYQVVGVVPDLRHSSLDEPPGPSYYISDVAGSMELVVRTSVDAAQLLPSIRGILRELDPALPLQISTARAELTERLAMRRFQAGLLAAFAVMALLLESFLFEVEPLDLGVYVAAALVLLLAAAAASYLPALAATKVEPMEAVRAEG